MCPWNLKEVVLETTREIRSVQRVAIGNSDTCSGSQIDNQEMFVEEVIEHQVATMWQQCNRTAVVPKKQTRLIFLQKRRKKKGG